LHPPQSPLPATAIRDEFGHAVREIMPKEKELSPDVRKIILAVNSFFEKNEAKRFFPHFKRRGVLVAEATGVSPYKCGKVPQTCPRC
jgi:hypothetical protein